MPKKIVNSKEIRYVYNVFVDGVYRCSAVLHCYTNKYDIVKHIRMTFPKGTIGMELHKALCNDTLTTELVFVGH